MSRRRSRSRALHGNTNSTVKTRKMRTVCWVCWPPDAVKQANKTRHKKGEEKGRRKGDILDQSWNPQRHKSQHLCLLISKHPNIPEKSYSLPSTFFIFAHTQVITMCQRTPTENTPVLFMNAQEGITSTPVRSFLDALHTRSP